MRSPDDHFNVAVAGVPTALSMSIPTPYINRGVPMIEYATVRPTPIPRASVGVMPLELFDSGLNLSALLRAVWTRFPMESSLSLKSLSI